MASVYLAGKISGIHYDASTEWRNYAAKCLGGVGIDTWSPMRAKEFLKNRTFTHDMYDEDLMASPSAILSRDRHDVMGCDVMLVNLLVGTHMGRQTCVEFGWADAFRKPIVLVDWPVEDKSLCPPIMQEMAGFRVHTLDEGLSVCTAILLQ